MFNCNYNMPRILAIEPEGFHRDFNAFLLRLLGTLGRVTFAAPAGYLKTCVVDARLDIPNHLLRHRTKLGARASAIRVLDHILRRIDLNNYDRVLLLAYETISFAIRWPRDSRAFVFEHNNIQNTQGSVIKTWFYRHISPNVTHLAFQEYIAEFIAANFNRTALHIPFPICRSNPGECELENRVSRRLHHGTATVIFSPSASTPPTLQAKLREFASSRNGAYYAICKGASIEQSTTCEVRPFFDNYDELMSNCDMVFFGGLFDHHVSAVAYDALSYGKPVVLLDSLFAQQLRKDHPHMVFVINEIDNIQNVRPHPEDIRTEHARFMRAHSFDAVRAAMGQALDILHDG